MSKARPEMTGFRVEIRPKRDFDRSVTVRSKWGLAFVFNNSDIGGGGGKVGFADLDPSFAARAAALSG